MDSTPMPNTDLSNCETEPIRYPGAVQPHGILLVLNQTDQTIEAASESCQALLGLSAKHFLGKTLEQMLGPVVTAVAQVHDRSVSLTFNGKSFLARSCRNETGQILVDIEPNDDSPAQALTDTRLHGQKTLRQHNTVTELAQAASELIRDTTGFDQVMVYRFDEDWNGEVIAEARAENITPSYLGLHFPASDIPKQSRDLFKLCPVRLISDVHYAPSALHAKTSQEAIDLGRSSLRSVSPMHIEYLNNMGTRATLVAALVVEDRLWGLVSCQHKSGPKYVSPGARDELAWLCESLAILIEARWIGERREREHHLNQRRRTLIESIRQFDLRQLMQDNADLLGVVGADGFALVVNGTVQTTGLTPDAARIKALSVQCIERKPFSNPLASSALCCDFAVEDVHDGVAGALFVTVLRKPVVTMIWFRREKHCFIKWAGDPEHAHVADESGRFSPRKSFDLFLQDTPGQSLAWSAEEIDSAKELGTLVEINALREGEAHFRQAQQIAGLGSWEWDLASGENRWSDEQYHIFGYAPGAVCPSYDVFFHALHPDDRTRVQEETEDALYDRAPYDIEFRIVRPDGSLRHIHSMGKVDRDQAGKALHMTGTLLDITQRIEPQQRLESLLNEQKTLLNNGLVGIAKAQNRRIVWANQAFEKMLGYSLGEMVGMETRRGYPSEGAWRAFGAKSYPLPPPGEIFRTEVELVRKDGQTIWVDLSGTVLDVATDISLWCYLDITERKRMDAERDRLQEIIEELPEFVGMVDMQCRQIYLNKAGVLLLGQPEDVNCSTLKIKDMQPPWAARLVLEEAIPTAIKEGIWKGETALLHRDGREIPVTQVVLVHRDKSGNPEHLSTLIHDISLQKAYEKDLTQAKEDAEAASRAKSEFLANMSHEIRTPMNGVVGMIDILQQTDLKPDQHRMLNTIAQSSQALLLILNDILDFSKIEAGMLTIERMATSLPEVANSVVLLMQSTAKAKSIDLSMWIDPKLPPLVWSDPSRLRQVLLNLLGNAVKFTQNDANGRVALRMEAGTQGEAVMRVIDNGIGMSEEVIAKLFQPFTQADATTSRRFGGSGLGLSISLRLVSLMGGKITVTSTPGQGSEFTVTLPLLDAPNERPVSSAPEQRSRVRPPTVDEALAKHQLVLLAEDNETNSDVLREQLRLLGYTSETATDGQMALQMWRSGRYALLLTDCHMPGMDGFELTAAIRLAEPAGLHMPIIAVTANAMHGESRRCLDSGMDDYLSKPLRLQTLGLMLDKWLPLQTDKLETDEVNTQVEMAIWDASTLGQLVGDNLGMHQRLLKKYLHNTPGQVCLIEAAAQAGQLQDAAKVAHTLKSASRMVGALALGELCQHIETAGLSGDSATCSALTASLSDAFAQAQNQIQSHLTNAKT